MVTKLDLIRTIEGSKDRFTFYYDKETDSLREKDTDSVRISMEDFFETYKKHNGMSFNCIYDNHICCNSVLECTECGTVVFYQYDEWYEHDFKCPVCTGYKTSFEYWTKDDIANDPEKQKCVQMYVNFTEYDRKRDERIKKRKGKSDDQLVVFELKGKKFIHKVELRCNDITMSYIKGLMLHITRWKINDDNKFSTYVKEYRIPLGITALLFEIKLKNYKKGKYKPGTISANTDEESRI